MSRKTFEIFSLFFVSFIFGLNKQASATTTQLRLGGTCPNVGTYTSLTCGATTYTDANYYYTCAYTTSLCSGTVLNLSSCTGCTSQIIDTGSTCTNATNCTCAGYYANTSTGSCIACPSGEYKSSTNIEYGCTHCPTAAGIASGVSTGGTGAITVSSCYLSIGSGYYDSIGTYSTSAVAYYTDTGTCLP